jgi:hypothetical protein
MRKDTSFASCTVFLFTADMIRSRAGFEPPGEVQSLTTCMTYTAQRYKSLGRGEVKHCIQQTHQDVALHEIRIQDKSCTLSLLLLGQCLSHAQRKWDRSLGNFHGRKRFSTVRSGGALQNRQFYDELETRQLPSSQAGQSYHARRLDIRSLYSCCLRRSICDCLFVAPNRGSLTTSFRPSSL